MKLSFNDRMISDDFTNNEKAIIQLAMVFEGLDNENELSSEGIEEAANAYNIYTETLQNRPYTVRQDLLNEIIVGDVERSKWVSELKTTQVTSTQTDKDFLREIGLI